MPVQLRLAKLRVGMSMKKDDFFVFVMGQFSFATIQDSATLLSLMITNGIDSQDFIKWKNELVNNAKLIRVERDKKLQEDYAEIKLKSKRCPVCGSVMRLDEVNNTNCTQVGGPWKSMWTCQSMFDCGEVDFSDLPIHKEAVLFGLERFYPDHTTRAKTEMVAPVQPQPSARDSSMRRRRRAAPVAKKPYSGCR
jgi:hypothetical protein